jgi:hypothetical protein
VSQVGIDPEHDRLEALLVERAAPVRHAALGRDVAERLAPEQLERLAQERGRAIGIPPGLFDEFVKAPGVEVELPGGQRIAGGAGHQQATQQRAQLREMDVQSRHGAGRRTVTPQLVDQAIARERHAAG